MLSKNGNYKKSMKKKILMIFDIKKIVFENKILKGTFRHFSMASNLSRYTYSFLTPQPIEKVDVIYEWPK